MKDLVKLQHGEFVSLSKVETVLKMSPLVDQICIHANSSQSVCIALVVPNQKRLTEVAAKIGVKDKSFEELCSDDKVSKEVLKQLADVGRKGKDYSRKKKLGRSLNRQNSIFNICFLFSL